MYLKLAFRNAKRSAFDYLLYITTMTILTAVMCVSNCIAVFGDIQAGFQTAALPLLIVLIMVVLVNYINTFMLKQRAKEFASYLLLGMEKSKLLQMFLMEFCFIGVVCFILGGLIGTGTYDTVFSNALQDAEIQLPLTAKSILQTLFFFGIVEILSAFRISTKIYKLQICELMNENRRNQPLGGDRKIFWGRWFAVSFFCLLLLLCWIVFLSNNVAYVAISFISIPLLCCVFAFYQWMYAYYSSKRLIQSEDLYQGNRLYRIAEMTTGTKTSALMSAIFCTCLLFAIISFVFGTFLLHKEIMIFDPVNQQWMGFLQISVCIIFMAIYFSILSLQQIIELKRQAKNILILHYMGKSQTQIRSLLKTQVMLKLFMPTLMCFALLLVGTPFINYKMNMALPTVMHNSLAKAVGWFIACFVILYLCYFLIVYIVSKRYIKTVISL